MSRAVFAVALSLLSVFVVGCGGGGGGSSQNPSNGGSTGQPSIYAIVISFPDDAAPTDLLAAGFNTSVSVFVENETGTAPITTATATFNGVPLVYSPTYQDYAAAVNLDPGATANLVVRVGGTTYTSFVQQFYTYPSIITPATNATWSSQTSNLISWAGASPNSTALFVLVMFDSSGNIVWPTNGELLTLPASENSYTVNANELTDGARLLLVGIVDGAAIAGATLGSGMIVGGFNYAQIDVSSTPPPPTVTLQSLVTTPVSVTLGLGNSRQLTATGTYSDGSTEDLTTRASWSTSNGAAVTVSATGLVAGAAFGSAVVTAEYAGLTADTGVAVFEPNPSPLPPLSESVTYQIDYAHSGYATVGGSGPTFPPSAQWSTTLNGNVSYPVVAEGKVIVTTDTNPSGMGYGTSLYALDLSTGSVAWGPIEIPGTYFVAGHAYDHGTVFVVNFDGLLRAFDVATGAAGWSQQLSQYAFTSPPTAVNGVVYVGGAGLGGTAYAVDEATGALLWTASVANGDHSSPTVSANGVFVSYPCQVYKFDPIVGTSLWHYAGPCSGGGGKTTAYADGQLYVRDPTSPPDRIFDAANGVELGTFSSTTIPALTGQAAYYLTGTTLTAVDRSTQNSLWTFTGDGDLRSAPIVIDSVVVIGSGNGAVYALDAATGAVVWTGQAANAISSPDEQNATTLVGLGVGGGYLVVPAGNGVQAWKITP